MIVDWRLTILDWRLKTLFTTKGTRDTKGPYGIVCRDAIYYVSTIVSNGILEIWMIKFRTIEIGATMKTDVHIDAVSVSCTKESP